MTPAEVTRLRRLGVTKVQLGAQSLDDRILALNRRGHTVEDTRGAVSLLRAAGFKIVLHWMPNLLGADLESDRERLPADVGRSRAAAGRDQDLPVPALGERRTAAYWQRGEYGPTRRPSWSG